MSGCGLPRAISGLRSLPWATPLHAQQAAEKALKGYLVSNGTAYPLTHDVRRLLALCEGIDRDLVAALAPAAGLTQFAVLFRYPGEEQPTHEEASPWLYLARLVCDQVSQRLPADADRDKPDNSGVADESAERGDAASPEDTKTEETLESRMGSEDSRPRLCRTMAV